VSREEKKAACRYNLIDSVVALNGALIVNAAILVVAATVFFRRGIVVTEIQQAHLLLAPLLGTALASGAFAIALLCAGQSSTLTGTLAGQIVMEGFINVRVQPWLRRFITRLMAVVPAVATIVWAGEAATYQLLLLSQVILSMQLPFAVIPLVQFTNDRRRMGDFANPRWLKCLSWSVVLLIVALNVWLVQSTVNGWLANVPQHRDLLLMILIPSMAALALLLGWVSFQPLFAGRLRRARLDFQLPPTAEADIPALAYRKILVPLDHSDRDPIAISHAAGLAKIHGGTVHVLHVEEGVTSSVYGEASSTGEVESFQGYFDAIRHRLDREGVPSELHVRHGLRPRNAIIAWARAEQPDLIVMGAHGHRLLGDLVLGATINAVRHELDIPILIVRKGRQ
jgi:manganese transport protein